MLKSALNTYLGHLDSLEKHLSILQSASAVNETVQGSTISDALKESVNNILHKNAEEKIFDYNANVISLYGFWENFIESLIKEYLSKLKCFGTKSDERNKRISSQYKTFTLPLFEKIRRKNPKFVNLKDKDLIDALYIACSQELNDYIPEPFFQSGGNYNFNEVSSSFKRLGFVNINQDLHKYPSLQKHYKDKSYTSDQINGSSTETLYSDLDSLVIMRNEIAHGSTATTIIDADGIKVYLAFMRNLGQSLNEYLEDDLYSILWNQKECVKIGIKNYYAHKNIGELHTGNYFIDKRKEVLFANGNKAFPHYGGIHIKEIYVNDTPYTEDVYLSLDTSDKVTISFEEKINKGMSLKFEC